MVFVGPVLSLSYLGALGVPVLSLLAHVIFELLFLKVFGSFLDLCICYLNSVCLGMSALCLLVHAMLELLFLEVFVVFIWVCVMMFLHVAVRCFCVQVLDLRMLKFNLKNVDLFHGVKSSFPSWSNFCNLSNSCVPEIVLSSSSPCVVYSNLGKIFGIQFSLEDGFTRCCGEQWVGNRHFDCFSSSCMSLLEHASITWAFFHVSITWTFWCYLR